jgi:hypothetical protein
MLKPEITEYAPYYERYIEQASRAGVEESLAAQPAELRRALDGITEERGASSYEAGKWTIKELLSHIIDGERIFGYRILRISRGDMTPIEGFEQDDYIATSNANNRSFSDLLDEFEFNRRANVLMVNNLDEAALTRVGTASDNPISARALVSILIGHVGHHLNILNERYLAQ